MKDIDFSKSVYQLYKEYPEVKEILYNLGFKDIAQPAAITTVGKMMNIPKGSEIKGVAMEKIISAFETQGFEIINKGIYLENEKDRQTILKSLIHQLHDGVSLNIVQQQFIKHFSGVSSQEIADAEQALIREGMPSEEVQRLCDVHSSLFHGRVEDAHSVYKDIPGHPVNIMYRENNEIRKRIEKIRHQRDIEVLKRELRDLKQLKQHYSKKEELFFPLLEAVGITGPTMVMWGVDDAIRDDIRLVQAQINEENRDSYTMILTKALDRAEEMIFKEEQILFPMAEQHFTKKQWNDIYRDFPEMGYCLIKDIPEWTDYEEYKQEETEVDKDTIKMNTGELNAQQLSLIFSAMPMDITFIDENDTVKFFTSGKDRIFPRPLSALGKQVYGCHGPKAAKTVRKLLKDFKGKKRTSMERWLIKEDTMVRVYYVALYDDKGRYRGTLETSQDMGSYKEMWKGGE